MGLIDVFHDNKVPKVVLRYIMMNFLDLDSIKKVILTVKELNILDNYSKLFLVNANKGFFWNCFHGHLDVAQWLYSIGCCGAKELQQSVANSQYSINMYGKCQDIVRWLDENNRHYLAQYIQINCNAKYISVIQYMEFIFILCCENGHLSVAQWLVQITQQNCGINIHVDNEVAFRWSCANGHLDVAQWLHSLCSVNIHANKEYAFRLSCKYGYLNVAKWLHSLGRSVAKATDQPAVCGQGNIDIHIYDEAAFEESCQNGHLDVAQWLYSLGDINIHADNEYAFRWSCGKNHWAIVQWLCSLGGIDIHAYSDFAFRISCENGHFSMAKWLHSQGGVDIHAKDDFAFQVSCANGHFAMAQWLHSQGSVNIHASDDFAFKNSTGEIKKWLKNIE